MKIVNRRAYHDYTVIKEFTAGIALVGSEVKSLRNGEANLQDSFCYSMDGEIFVKGLHISKNKMSSFTNHEEKRDRKLWWKSQGNYSQKERRWRFEGTFSSRNITRLGLS